MSAELHRIGVFSVEMLRVMTNYEIDKVKILYDIFYDNYIGSEATNAANVEIMKLWRDVRVRLNKGVTNE